MCARNDRFLFLTSFFGKGSALSKGRIYNAIRMRNGAPRERAVASPSSKGNSRLGRRNELNAIRQRRRGCRCRGRSGEFVRRATATDLPPAAGTCA